MHRERVPRGNTTGAVHRIHVFAKLAWGCPSLLLPPSLIRCLSRQLVCVHLSHTTLQAGEADPSQRSQWPTCLNHHPGPLLFRVPRGPEQSRRDDPQPPVWKHWVESVLSSSGPQRTRTLHKGCSAAEPCREPAQWSRLPGSRLCPCSSAAWPTASLRVQPLAFGLVFSVIYSPKHPNSHPLSK